MLRTMKATITMITEMMLKGTAIHTTIAMSITQTKFIMKSFIIILE
jgi:hypothetical protein